MRRSESTGQPTPEIGLQRWPLWIAGVRSTFDAVDEAIATSQEGIEIPRDLLRRLPEARAMVDNFLHHPQEEMLVDSSHGASERRVDVPRFVATTGHVVSDRLSYRQGSVTAVLDPEGPMLPEEPEAARTQVRLMLTDLDAEAEADIRSRMLELRHGLDDLALSGRPAEVIQERGEAVAEAYRSLAGLSVTEFGIRMQRAHFQWGPGVITTPLLTVKLAIKSTGTVKVFAEHSVGGLQMESEIPVAAIAHFPSRDARSLRELKALFDTIYTVIHRHSENGGRKKR